MMDYTYAFVEAPLASMPVPLRVQLDPAGTHFSIWQPNAKQVCVVGPFNRWNGQAHRMLKSNGYWRLYIPGFHDGMEYKFEVMTANEEAYLVAEPATCPWDAEGVTEAVGRRLLV
ncbi:hypothetical protein [Paenibacillus koleovorans]|uniref:hypothetical protein n=1 Tax=Paenibacillus koleovorans TaxID=121608 RepID=UPI000FDA8101|nr:hypothetical protein [Paenibacillus koleovorans]